LLTGACPIVGSFGARDPLFRKAPERLERAMTRHGVDHDIEVYPQAGHAFINDHRDDLPARVRSLDGITRMAYHEPSARDARRRIIAFFDAHLKP